MKVKYDSCKILIEIDNSSLNFNLHIIIVATSENIYK